MEEFVESQEQYIVKIREILSNPRKLLNILEMEAPLYTMIYWKNILLAIPKTWICDMKDAFETSFKQKIQKEKTIQKPYGDSWFSPEAHENRNVLKSEFRELAKEYHPDHYSGLESVSITKVFQEIFKKSGVTAKKGMFTCKKCGTRRTLTYFGPNDTWTCSQCKTRNYCS